MAVGGPWVHTAQPYYGKGCCPCEPKDLSIEYVPRMGICPMYFDPMDIVVWFALQQYSVDQMPFRCESNILR